MKPLAEGARRLPAHHLTIRVPWHDAGWSGTVCQRPLENTSCLVLPRIGENKQDKIEVECPGQRFDELSRDRLPPCVGERASFMAPFPLVRSMSHPYVETSAETHGHLAPTRFKQLPYSAACVPFRWVLRETIEGPAERGEPGLAEQLKLGWIADREPDLPFETAWVQQRDNQLAILDTFFGAVRPKSRSVSSTPSGRPYRSSRGG
jgi:hypothetical protein